MGMTTSSRLLRNVVPQLIEIMRENKSAKGNSSYLDL